MPDLQKIFAHEIAAGHVIERIRKDLGQPWLDTRAVNPIPVMGVMLHYDAGASDRGGLAWLLDGRNSFGYNLYVFDDGQAYLIILGRAAHAGKTRSSDPVRLPYPQGMGNAAFISISAAAREGDLVTDAQKGTILRLGATVFQAMGWSIREESWRLTDHYEQAWPRGRKVDVIGWDPTLPDSPKNRHREKPVIDMHEMRRWFSTGK